MAVAQNVLAQGEYQFVSIASDDPGIEPGSTPGDFKCRLAVPLQFPGGPDAWMVAVSFASFHSPGANLYQVATSVNQRTIAGTQSVDTLAIIPAAAASTTFSWTPTSTLVQWLPIASDSITELEIEIADIDGVPLAAGKSVVTLAFRRVGSAK